MRTHRGWQVPKQFRLENAIFHQLNSLLLDDISKIEEENDTSWVHLFIPIHRQLQDIYHNENRRKLSYWIEKQLLNILADEELVEISNRRFKHNPIHIDLSKPKPEPTWRYYSGWEEQFQTLEKSTNNLLNKIETMANKVKSTAKKAAEQLNSPSKEKINIVMAPADPVRNVDLGKSFSKMFPEDHVNLSIIQEGLIQLPVKSQLAASYVLGARTDIRATIEQIKADYDKAQSYVEGIVPQYILDLIISY